MRTTFTDPGAAGSEAEGCAYILNDSTVCGADRRDRSSYCDRHHRRCYISRGSAAEAVELSQIELLSRLFGGRLPKRDQRAFGLVRQLEKYLRQ